MQTKILMNPDPVLKLHDCDIVVILNPATLRIRIRIPNTEKKIQLFSKLIMYGMKCLGSGSKIGPILDPDPNIIILIRDTDSRLLVTLVCLMVACP